MENNRYIRQELLPEIGKTGQKKLGDAHVCIVGCGGLGSIVAPYLAGAGVGTLSLIDGDKPELSNLHRQVFFTGNENCTKAEALAIHINKTNPEVKTIPIAAMLSKKSIEVLHDSYDLIIECTDDMMCKYLVNDWCHLNNVPLIYGAIFKYEGYLSLFENKDESSIHLRDIFPEPDLTIPTCSEVGVLGTTAGLIGMLQANEALKFLLGFKDSLNGVLLTYNTISNEQFKMKLKKTWNKSIQDVYDEEMYITISCEIIPELSVEELLQNSSAYKIVSILEDHEHELINNDCVHQPLSGLLVENWESSEVPTVFYCMSGKRSGMLVEQLLSLNASANVYSLKGGMKAYKKTLS